MLLDLVKLALEHEKVDFRLCKLEFSQTDQSKGHTGNITSVLITEETINYQKNLIIKWHEQLSITNIPIIEIFNQEIFVYTTVQEAFKKLMHSFNFQNNLLPHCYATVSNSVHQALILENLESQKFRLHDQRKALDFSHVKIILEAYGKWHGLSFVLKALRLSEFEKITKDFLNMFPYVLKKANRIEGRQKDFCNVRKELLTEENEEILKYLDFTDTEIEYALTEMHLEDRKYQVITHGDCWINNFMFYYEKNSEEPIDVRILDWQCSGLTSPIFDLSHFIYSCTDTLSMKNIHETLSIYHCSMLNFLKNFHLDIEEIFPFKTLEEHWQRFSHYGLLLSTRILKDSLSGGRLDLGGDFLLTGDSLIEFSNRVCNNFVHYGHNRRNII